MGQQHSLTLSHRERLAVEGVKEVLSYDEREIQLDTVMGILILKGKGLKILNLDGEKGSLEAQGFFHSLVYSEGKGAKGKGFLRRLLK